MKDQAKTNEQLIGELAGLRQRIAELEAAETDHRRAEEALRASEERYRVLAEVSRDSIYVINRDDSIEYVNEFAARQFECSPEELIGKPRREFFPPDIADRQWQALQEAFESGQPVRIEDRIRFPYDEVWLDNYLMPLKKESGQVRAVMGVSRDITERKQVEEALRGALTELTVIHQNVPIAMMLMDRDRRVCKVDGAAALFASRAGEEMLGLRGGEALRCLHHLDDPQGCGFGPACATCAVRLAVLDTFAARESRRDVEARMPFLRDDSVEERCLLVSTAYLQMDDTEQVLVCAQDITDRKRAEEALRESGARYRAIVEAFDGLIYVCSQDYRIEFMNKQLLERTGYDGTGELCYKVLHDLDSICPWCVNNRVFAGETVRWEIQSPKDNHWYYAVDTPIYNADGSMSKQSMILDITERKQAEEALRESEEKFRNLAEQSPNMIFINAKKRIVYANEKCTEITGYTREEFYAPDFDFWTLIAPESIDLIKKLYGKHMKGEEIPPYEYTLITKEGRRIEAINATKLIQYAGEHALLGIVTDISEHKKAEQKLQHSYQQMQEMLVTVVNALASTVEMKDQYTAGHQPRVTQLACAIAEEMGLSEEQIEGIRMAGLIHDIGKIIVPAEILNKPGPVTEIQYEMVKMHSRAGYDILKDIKFPWPVAEIVLQHHELMDGSGYPEGLSGDEILLEAKILAVANVVEAMTSHRPYRPAYDIKEALAEISKNKGILYDPVVVDACLKLFTEKQFTFD
jgi:PAS domain S-box-containing protein/putative nucleotidyltransferase with HDIG domain